MNEKEKTILETICKALQGMSELEKEKLLAFSEGMAYMAGRRADAAAKSDKPGGAA